MAISLILREIPAIDQNEVYNKPVKAELWALGFLFFEIYNVMSPEWSEITESYKDRYKTTAITAEDIAKIKARHDTEVGKKRNELVEGAIESRDDILTLLILDLLAWKPDDRPTVEEIEKTLSIL